LEGLYNGTLIKRKYLSFFDVTYYVAGRLVVYYPCNAGRPNMGNNIPFRKHCFLAIMTGS
jgi:hypothetical protein